MVVSYGLSIFFANLLLVSLAAASGATERYGLTNAYFLTRLNFCDARNISGHKVAPCQRYNTGGYVPISLVVTRQGGGALLNTAAMQQKNCGEVPGLLGVTIGTERGRADFELEIKCDGTVKNATKKRTVGRLTPYVSEVAEFIQREAGSVKLISDKSITFYNKNRVPIFSFLRTTLRVLYRYVEQGKPLMNVGKASNASAAEEVLLTLGGLGENGNVVNVSLSALSVYRVELGTVVRGADAGGIVAARAMLHAVTLGRSAVLTDGERKASEVLAMMQGVGFYRDGQVTVIANNDTRATFYLTEDDSIWRAAVETYTKDGRSLALFGRLRYMPAPSEFAMTLRLEKLTAEGQMRVTLFGAYEVSYKLSYDEGTGQVQETRRVRKRSFGGGNATREDASVQQRVENILKRSEKMIFDDEGRATFITDLNQTRIRFDPMVRLVTPPYTI